MVYLVKGVLTVTFVLLSTLYSFSQFEKSESGLKQVDYFFLRNPLQPYHMFLDYAIERATKKGYTAKVTKKRHIARINQALSNTTSSSPKESCMGRNYKAVILFHYNDNQTDSLGITNPSKLNCVTVNHIVYTSDIQLLETIAKALPRIAKRDLLRRIKRNTAQPKK